MARINLEDSLYRDPRWMNLILKVGCPYRAKGILVTAWAIAQENWLKYRAVPEKAWLKDLDVLLDCEFAAQVEVEGKRMIYVKGSKNQFAWLEQRSKAGKSKSEKKLHSVEKARHNISREITGDNDGLNGRSMTQEQKTERELNGTERGLNGTQRELNGSNPLSLSLSLPLSLTQIQIQEELLHNSSSDGGKKLSSAPSEMTQKAKKRPQNELFLPENENALISAINVDQLDRWGSLYPDKSFLNREAIKAFNYYQNNPAKMPRTLAGWKRALSSWFERGWPRHVRTIESVEGSATDWSDVFKKEATA